MKIKEFINWVVFWTCFCYCFCCGIVGFMIASICISRVDDVKDGTG